MMYHPLFLAEQRRAERRKMLRFIAVGSALVGLWAAGVWWWLS